MAQIELAAGLVADFDRILAHLVAHEATDPPARIREIVAAIEVLASSPRIGRLAPHDLRELVIGKGPRGYVALYRYEPALDRVYVLAIRGQREAGYRDRTG